jgi:type II restriction/modification system DNA methylase subunit YeeA
VPDSRLYAIARGDDATFGIRHSRFHQAWSLATYSWHGDGEEGGRPTYNAHSCFETFPFPQGLTPNIPAAEYANDPRAQKIAAAAWRLNELRKNWLNPPDLIMRVPEVVEGYPDRILPKDESAAQALKQRTLTNLYNERPAWLDNAHRNLDEAVADAYGWPSDMPDDEMLTKLLALNLERVKEGV